MKVKKHPTYKKNYNLLKWSIFSIILLIIIFNLCVETENYRENSFYICIIVGLIGLSYNNIIGKILKCPECKNKLTLLEHEINVPSKSECTKCKIIWDLGVPFKTHNDRHDYDD